VSTLAWLLAAAVVIYLSCELFVNAVEWLGRRLRVGALAVGTVLAAFGTALPESVVTLVAVTVGGGPSGDAIGMGAALGGPLALGTVAYAAVGLALLVRRRSARVARLVPAGRARPGAGPPDPSGDAPGDPRLARDQALFLAIFAGKVALGLVAFTGKAALGVLFLTAYVAYLLGELRRPADAEDTAELAPLRLQPRRARPALWAVLAQTLGSLTVIFLASRLFVHQLEVAAPQLGLGVGLTALLLSPLATELPEITNALIWVRQGKTRLALANVSGSMMIQATVPSALGLFFTPWLFDGPLLLAGVVTALSVGYLLLLFRRGRLRAGGLAGAGAFYLLFAGALLLLPA